MSKMLIEYGYYQSGARGWRSDRNAWDRRYGRSESESKAWDSMEFGKIPSKAMIHSTNEELQKSETRER